MKLIFDLETDNLLDNVTTIHCLVIKDTDTGDVFEYIQHDEPVAKNVADGLHKLMSADKIIGHNIIKFDLAVIKKLYPWFTIDENKVEDTLVLSRLIHTNIKDTDQKLLKQNILPGKLFGSHSLAAWGYRLGNYKGDYDGGWETFNEEMLSYCRQDVEVTHHLYKSLTGVNYSQQAITLEHQVAWLMAKQERNGFCFNETAAAELYATLAKRRGELDQELRDYFGSWTVKLPDMIPKRDNKTLGYKAGVPVKKTKEVMFNPSSRDHISNRLITLYGWKPEVFTEGGKPQVDEVILSKLDYPPCKLLTEYLLVQKRISQLAEGDQAWMKLSKNGKIHGSVNTNGAVTGRCTHAYPNISQVPSSGSPYGHECRSLFVVPKGWVLVGADASGLELRCLAHYMAKYDDGAYGKVLLDGDIHTENQKAAGLSTRPQAKTFIYAFLYGGGDGKLGTIVGGDDSAGRRLRSKFLRSLPALGRLVDGVKEASKRGYLVGLDGRRLHVRSAHSALNTLLQSAGALICKTWIVNVERLMLERGYKHGWDGDFAFCAFSHDEIQVAVRDDETLIAEYREITQEAMKIAEGIFNFRCQLDTESKVGKDWSETH